MTTRQPPDPRPGPVTTRGLRARRRAGRRLRARRGAQVVEWLTRGAQLLGVHHAGRRASARDAGLGSVARRRGLVLHRPGVDQGPEPARPARRRRAPRERRRGVHPRRPGRAGRPTPSALGRFDDLYEQKYDVAPERAWARPPASSSSHPTTALAWTEADFPTTATRFAF